MPYKANEPRRHRIPRARYRVSNWPEYDRALQQRGSLTVWMTPEALAAWQPTQDGSAGPVTHVLGYRDRDRAPAAPGLWPALAADRRPAALARHPARLVYRRSRPYDLLPAQPRPDARQVAGAGPEDRTCSCRDRFNWPEGVRRRRVAEREAWRAWPADLAQTPSRGRSQQRRDPCLRADHHRGG